MKKKPKKEKYGFIENNTFDSELSGFVIEGGEEAYDEAIKQWKFMQDKDQEKRNLPQCVKDELGLLD